MKTFAIFAVMITIFIPDILSTTSRKTNFENKSFLWTLSGPFKYFLLILFRFNNFQFP